MARTESSCRELALHFAVFDGVPRQAKITPAVDSEPAQLKAMLKPSLTQCDRPKVSRLLAVSSHRRWQVVVHCVGQRQHRVCSQTERVITQETRQTGVIRDLILSRLGNSHYQDEVQQPLRFVVVAPTNDESQPIELWLVTDCHDLAADHVAVGDRYRWTIELFFRWFKRILGC